jgi:8-amino-7-oxononanoate synthase
LDLFDKCYAFKRHEEVKAMGLYPYFQPIYENYGPIVKMDGREIVMAGSNNYLGLTTDPRVKEAAIEAIKKYGTGCSGSRYLNGTLDIHIKLEEQLAEFVGKEAALLFSTGFQTNQGAIVPLIGKDEYVISDKDNHASIVQGTLISKGLWGNDVLVRYRHNDMQHLEEVISKLPIEAGKLIVTDGVFSMSGNIVNLPELVRIARKYNARIMLDDAHGLGVLGKGGRGTANHFGLDDEVDIIMGTFSKSFASLGGFIAGEKPVIDYIKHHSPALIFSASMTPAQVAAVLKALEIIKSEPERIERLHYNANRVRRELKNLGFRVLDGQTPIVPVVIGDDLLTFKFWRLLFDNGVFVNAVISPAVPQGMQLLRLSFMATHEDKHLDIVIEKFEKVGKELALID